MLFRRCNCELEDERQTVQQLRSYIGTSLPSATDNNNVASVLEEENATLKIQLQVQIFLLSIITGD